jgi:hypothetical protein
VTRAFLIDFARLITNMLKAVTLGDLTEVNVGATQIGRLTRPRAWLILIIIHQDLCGKQENRIERDIFN